MDGQVVRDNGTGFHRGDSSARWKTRLVWLLGIGATLVVAVYYSSSRGVRSAEGDRSVERAPLEVVRDTLDFGTVSPQPGYQHTIICRNTTAYPIRVTELSASCGCASIEPESFLLPAGAQQSIRLTLDLAPANADVSSFGTTDFAVTVFANYQPVPGDVRDPSPIARSTWAVTGKVLHVLRLSMTEVHFLGSDRLRYGRAHSSMTVKVHSRDRLDELVATCIPELAEIAVSPSGDSGRKFDLIIVPNTNLPPGPFEFRVNLKPVAEGRELSGVSVPVVGRVEDDIRGGPAVVSLGSGPIGCVLEYVVCLHSTSDTPFAVLTSECELQNSQVVEIPEMENETRRTYRITCRVGKAGSNNGTCRFQVMQRGETRWIRIPITRYGITNDSCNK